MWQSINKIGQFLSTRIALLIIVLMVGVLMFDLMTPLGVADGVLYVAVVLLAPKLHKARLILFVAGICTFLTILGYFLSPPGGIHWMVLANRSLAIFTIWVTAILLFQRQQVEQVLREFPPQLIHFQDAETERIAKEIHEGIAQSISALQFSVQLISTEKNEKKDVLEKQKKEITEQLKIIIENCRQLAYGIHPSSLYVMGVEEATRSLIDHYRRNNPWDIEVSLKPFKHLIKKDMAVNFYRIVQEALSNVENHAQAKSVQIKIRAQNGLLQLIVKDNGKGFVTKGSSYGVLKKGLGLTTMAERAKLLGGKFSLSSIPGSGTTVEVHVPIVGAQ